MKELASIKASRKYLKQEQAFGFMCPGQPRSYSA